MRRTSNKNNNKKHYTGQVRTAIFEVVKINDEPVYTKNLKKSNTAAVRWHNLSDQCKQVVNCIWQTWLVWHIENGSAGKLRAWLDIRAEIKRLWESDCEKIRSDTTKRKKQKIPKLSTYLKRAGKCPVLAMSKELQNHIYHTLSKLFTDMNKRVVVLIMNTTISDLKQHKASKGSLPGHSAILLCHQSIPSSTHPQPIPFDCENTKMLPSVKPGENYKVELRVWRMNESNRKRCPSVIDTVELYSRGRKIQGELAKLKRIMSGEYKFCGSNLVYERQKHKWFIHLCYQMPTMVCLDLDPEKIATLQSHSHRPWHFILPGVSRREWPGGRGYYVAGFRRRIFLQRRSRSHEYRNANTNRKGHGRNRAMSWRWKFQSLWNTFVKRMNHKITSQVVKTCVDHGIGTLVFFQPDGEFSGSRFLSTTGKDPDWNDNTTWQWFQVTSMLKYKCQAVGIRFLDGSDGRKAIAGKEL